MLLDTLFKVAKGLKTTGTALIAEHASDPGLDPALADLVGLLKDRSPSTVRLVTRVVLELLDVIGE